MISQNTIIKNSQGMHMRPAGILSKEMNRFKSNVSIIYNGSSFDAKSVMMVMTACLKCGSHIEIQCDGPDETEAMNAILLLIDSGFGEL